MNYQPEAFFDSLYLSKNLGKELGDIAFSEINLFSYLACLLSLYDANPVSFWGYKFIKNDFGSPYSKELEQSIETSIEMELFEYVDNTFFTITEKGSKIFERLEEHTQYQDRMKYLRTVYECLTMLPYGVVKESISNEPLLSSARNHETRKILIEDESGAIAVLYNNFEFLKKALSNEYDDLIVPAVVWLRKIFEQRSVQA